MSTSRPRRRRPAENSTDRGDAARRSRPQKSTPSWFNYLVEIASIGLALTLASYLFRQWQNQPTLNDAIAIHDEAPMLKANLGVLSEEQKALALELLELDQAHLFSKWDEPGTNDARKHLLFEQVKAWNEQFPGGLSAYVATARRLLEDSKNGVNPMDGYTPKVPSGERLTFGEPSFDHYEAIGAKEIGKTAFVIVAGGLGERLGYNGIKLELPSDLVTESCYLELYIQYILAAQDRARQTDANVTLPLFIMTSDDTHDKTVRLLEDNNYFGMPQDQLTLVKQNKVPALVDNDAHLAVGSDGYTVITKPHGHGDVHMLLHQSGVASEWAAAGKEWVVFFQDTNAIAIHSFLATIGVSKEKGFEFNSVTVPRKPGEACGAIMRLEKGDGSGMTCCVEYNMLSSLLKATVSPEGDMPDDSGFSPYPGNINTLVIALQPYVKVLERTSGIVPEFVNPKYADEAKTVFKKPTRVECMMQDYPKGLDSNAKVGFLQLDRWVCFSAVKNDIVSAAGKAVQTGFPESASSGEADIYYYHRRLLHQVGVDIDVEGKFQEYAGVPTRVGAAVVLTPSFGVSRKEIADRFTNPSQVKISNKSVVLLDGDITIDEMDVDGALVVKAAPGAKVHLKRVVAHNAGWAFDPVSQDSDVEEKYRIRGYVMKRAEARVIEFKEVGTHTVLE